MSSSFAVKTKNEIPVEVDPSIHALLIFSMRCLTCRFRFCCLLFFPFYTRLSLQASAETSKENHLEPAKADAEEKTVAAAEFTAGTETAEEEHEADEEEEGGEVAAKEDGEED